MKIIYKQTDDASDVAVVIPSPNWIGSSGKKIKDLTDDELPIAMEELAQRNVPTGLKYKIVADNFIPDDRTFRNAWEIAESELTDGVGA
jgi:hypothetical protein